MSQFGYVLDVYMPRDKVKRTEHRGFGFVTFETAAAIERVALNAPHRIKYIPHHSFSIAFLQHFASELAL